MFWLVPPSLEAFCLNQSNGDGVKMPTTIDAEAVALPQPE
jgi:hypothetical protein